MKNIILAVLISASVISCKQNNKTTKENHTKEQSDNDHKTTATLDIYGNYVDDSYDKRAEGSDWVAVSVKKNDANSIMISVRSRADIKKPTCTFDAKAIKKSKNSYQAVQEGKKINFDFSNGNITISAIDKEDASSLTYFCNGGATLEGSYKKISENLDTTQIDLTSFQKTLTLEEIGFNVSSIKNKGKNTFSVFAYGLSEGSYKETFEIEGEQIVNIEVGDLDADASPELLIYTQSDGSGSYGNVYAFSVNNKKSVSAVYCTPTAENKKINEGYMGHDTFTLVNNVLTQSFPIYKKGDSNASPTGGTKQVFYKLVNGEASKKLIVDKVNNN